MRIAGFILDVLPTAAESSVLWRDEERLRISAKTGPRGKQEARCPTGANDIERSVRRPLLWHRSHGCLRCRVDDAK